MKLALLLMFLAAADLRAQDTQPASQFSIDESLVDKMFEKTIEEEPEKYGYDFNIWTVDRMREHLAKETGIELGEKTMRVLLGKLGYRYRRPKQDLGHLQDKTAKQEAAEQLKKLKKRQLETISHSSLWTKQP